MKHSDDEIDEAILFRLLQGDRYVHEEIPRGGKIPYIAALLEKGRGYREVSQLLKAGTRTIKQAKVLLETKGRMMAGLPPDGEWLVQQADGVVSIFNQYTQEVLLKFDPSDREACRQAQFEIWHEPHLNDEQRCFASFWSGYFYAHASQRGADG